MKRTDYKPVPESERVTWLDHFANHVNESYTLVEIAGRVKEDFVQVNEGFLVYEDDDKLVLAHEARIDADLDEAKFSHYTAIYKVCILKRIKMGETP